jgi:heme exporter protein C
MKKTLVFVCALLAVGGFAISPWLAFEKAPLAPYYELLFNQKIFYFHVPCAWVMFVAAFTSGIASIGYLRSRDPGWDDVAWAAGDMVTLFGALVLTSGPIWAKASWGVYWKWDARLTTSLLLWMIFVAYSLVRRYGGLGSERLAAGMAVFGMADVPLIYFAVNLWKTQHPENTVVRSLAPGMRPPFYLASVTFVLFFVVLLVARLAVGRGQRLLHAAQDRWAELE